MALDDAIAMERRLGIRFEDRRLLRRAFLPRPTVNGDSAEARPRYQATLARIGDGVIDLAINMYALDHVEIPWTVVVQLMSIIRLRVMAAVATEYELVRNDGHTTGEGYSERLDEAQRARLIKAIIGAVHCDQGYEAAYALTQRIVLWRIPQLIDVLFDERPQCFLEAIGQRDFRTTPSVSVQSDGEGKWLAEVTMAAHTTQGQGRSQAEAHRNACRAYLDYLQMHSPADVFRELTNHR